MQTVSLFALVSLFAFTYAASVVPIDSSSVNVKHSGQDYSYTINENHGVAIEPLSHQPIPVIKYAPDDHGNKHQEYINEKQHHEEIKPLSPANDNHIGGMTYTLPIAAIPAYTYLPAHQYALRYPYSINNYPYNLITTF